MEGCKGSLETVCIQVRLIIPKISSYKGELVKKKIPIGAATRFDAESASFNSGKII